MAFYDKLKGYLDSARGSVDTMLAKMSGTYGIPTDIPSDTPEDKEKVATFVDVLLKDSEKWVLNAFNNSAYMRHDKGSPYDFWKSCKALESGNHWHQYGWGKRNDTPGDNWKQERVDNEIGNQIRVRNAHITANWHDISILPNIAHFSQVFDQERKKNGWGQTVKNWVKSAQTFGTATVRLELDRSVDRDGIVRPVLCDNGSVWRTPHTVSYSKADGCWYTQWVSMVNDKWVADNYPEIDITDLSMSQDLVRKLNHDLGILEKPLDATKYYPRIETYLDDPTLAPGGLDKEQEDRITAEHEGLIAGREMPVAEDDNHVEHVRAHHEALQTLASVEPQSEEEAAQVALMAEVWSKHIEDHIAEHLKLDTPNGLVRKYPFGRYIVTIGGKVVQDEPNPYRMDWRRLFYDLANEKVIGRIDGRGDVEILWHDNKTLDTELSRIADITLALGIPKVYRQINDKESKDIEPDSNDPTKVSYFQSVPPVIVQGHAPPEMMAEYQAANEKIQNRLGINKITYGKSPTAQASGDLADTLLMQNQVLVAGELDTNLSDCIEEMVEAMIELYKNFYTEPRQYWIQGQLTTLTVSDILSKQIVKDDAGEHEEEIQKFEVTIKPYSNFPNKWENDLAMLFALQQRQTGDGAPLVPDEAIYDQLAERFPEFGENGKWRRLNQATAIGLQMMAQQQQLEAQQAATLKTVNRDFVKQKIAGGRMGPQPTNGNSKPQLQPQPQPV